MFDAAEASVMDVQLPLFGMSARLARGSVYQAAGSILCKSDKTNDVSSCSLQPCQPTDSTPTRNPPIFS